MRSPSSVCVATALFSSGPGSKKNRGNQPEGHHPPSPSYSYSCRRGAGFPRAPPKERTRQMGYCVLGLKWRVSLQTLHSVRHGCSHTQMHTSHHHQSLLLCYHRRITTTPSSPSPPSPHPTQACSLLSDSSLPPPPSSDKLGQQPMLPTECSHQWLLLPPHY